MSEWLPVATLVAGVVGTLGGQALTSKGSAQREENARAAERRVASDAFQRETLLEVQDALTAYMTSTTAIYMHELDQFRETGRYGRTSTPDQLNEGHRTATQVLVRLRERIIDDDLRQRLRALQGLAAEVLVPGLEKGAIIKDDNEAATAAALAFNQLAVDQDEFSKRLGVVLRRLI